LIHADLRRLADRRVSADGVTGYADVTGTYRNGTLTVTRQVAAGAHVARPALFHDYVPCPAPDGGWPSGPQPSPDRAQAYASAHPDQVVEVALLNPSRSQSLVYVLTTGDPSTIERDLRAAYGQSLCVATSKYSIEQLGAARRLLDSMSKRRSSRFYEGGSGGLTSAEQPRITVSVAILAERDAQAIDAQPAGLWQLTVWLKPVTH
jgi:hypothetical protein